MLDLCISSARTPAGTLRTMGTLHDAKVGATVLCTRSTRGAMRDREYTIVGLTPTCVDLERNKKVIHLKPMELLQSFERRLGPVVKGSICRGLTVKATMDGKTYRNGDILKLTETGGSVCDCKDSNGNRCSVTKDELLVCFIYV